MPQPYKYRAHVPSTRIGILVIDSRFFNLFRDSRTLVLGKILWHWTVERYRQGWATWPRCSMVVAGSEILVCGRELRTRLLRSHCEAVKLQRQGSNSVVIGSGTAVRGQQHRSYRQGHCSVRATTS